MRERRTRDSRRGGSGGLSAAGQFRALFAGRPDAVMLESQNVTTSSGNVTGWFDALDPTHVLAPTGTVAAPVASPRFAGKSALSLTGTQYFISNRAPSRFAFLNDGAAASVLCRYAPIDVAGNYGLWSTYTSATVRGAYQYGVIAGSNNHQVGTQKTGLASSSTGAVGSVAAGVALTTEWYGSVASAPDIAYYQNGSSLYTGDYSSAPEAGDPGMTLCIGALVPPASNLIKAEIRGLYFFPYVLSPQQRATALAYIASVS